MLKIGIIKYLNIYPIYSNILKCDFCKFIYSEPSKLNLLLRKGEIDIAPSSSYEYLKNKNLYNFVENFSISSRQKIMSVILILEKEIHKIDKNDTIFLSPSSASSNTLLKIIFYEFYNKKPNFVLGEENKFFNKNQVIIGDNALEVYFNKEKLNYYIYDLAEIWYKFTGLPFVFALWIYNKNNLNDKIEYFEIFKKILKKSIRSYVIPDKYKNFTSEQIQEYFQNIDYEFKEVHKKSLNLYEELLKKWNLI